MVQVNELLLSSPEAQGVSSSAILDFVNDVERKPNIYQMVVQLTETPFSITTTFRFDDDQLYLDEEVNVSFEETKRWQLIGCPATT